MLGRGGRGGYVPIYLNHGLDYTRVDFLIKSFAQLYACKHARTVYIYRSVIIMHMSGPLGDDQSFETAHFALRFFRFSSLHEC